MARSPPGGRRRAVRDAVAQVLDNILVLANAIEAGGSGLGLAIVAQLASAAGGDATLLPADGTGVDAQVRFAAPAPSDR